MPAAFSAHPAGQGLYDPAHEQDACGVAFVATLTGVATHGIVDQALTALRNLEHRGASGAEPDSGDGAGILVQVPDAFLRAVVDFALPPKGEYAVGTAFLPDDDAADAAAVERIDRAGRGGGAAGPRLARRCPPTRPCVGATARAVMPRFRQLFVAARSRPGRGARPGAAGLRAAQAGRARAGRLLPVAVRPARSSTRACSPTGQLEPFFPDLSDPRFDQRAGAGALPVLHQHLPVLAAGPPVPATSPTTARSTRSRATATGCGPARRCWPPT